jgi:hypothetical protein
MGVTASPSQVVQGASTSRQEPPQGGFCFFGATDLKFFYQKKPCRLQPEPLEVVLAHDVEIAGATANETREGRQGAGL